MPESIVSLKPVPGHSEFYFSPLSDYMAVAKDGRVLNLRTGKEVKVSSTGDQNYKLAWVYIGGGRTKSIYHHRLIASVFVDRPERHLNKDIKDLEVNHKDGDKENNDPSNLEWVTTEENAKHAKETWLNTQHTPVLARHVNTGEVRKFFGQKDCAKAFGLAIMRLNRHLYSDKKGMLSKNWFVFKFDDGSEWPVIPEDSVDENTWDNLYSVIIAENLETKQKIIATTADELGSFFCDGYNNNAFSIALKKSIRNGFDHVIRGVWKIWRKDIPTAEEYKQAGVRCKPEFKKPIPVDVRELETGVVTRYPSARAAGVVLGFGPNWGINVLKKQNKLSNGYLVLEVT